jgi:PGF-pre-PGF domain-containing protein
MIIFFAGIFSVFILAQGPILTVRVSNIVNNGTITSNPVANVTLINCSNGAVLAYNTTANGLADFDVDGSWNFSILVNVSKNYINKTDDNGGSCYQLSADTHINEEVYPLSVGSFNVTILDYVNGRPVPDVEVLVYPEGSSDPTSQSQNYRCDSGVCKTDGNGNILLTVSQSDSPPCGNYNFSVVDSEDNYKDKNTPIFTGPCAGNDKDVSIEVEGEKVISGYVTDKYSSQMRVSGANITLWNHSTPTKMFGWGDKYFYNGTTDDNGYYEIRLPTDLLCTEAQNENCWYDVKVEADNYLTTYSKGDGDNGYIGAQPIDLSLTGPLDVSGKVIDLTNGRPVYDAKISITNETEDFEYTIYTDTQGDFSLKIRNNTGYKLIVSMDGYEDNGTYDSISGSQNLGNISIMGKALVVGKITDWYKDQFDSDIPLVATVSFNSGPYDVTSDTLGDFSINVRSGVYYTITVTKTGYYSTASQLNIIENPSGNISAGTIKLAGKHEIYGTIYDSEPGAVYDKLDGVDVLVHDSYHTYKTTSNVGDYAVNISSVNNDYYLEMQKNGFDTRVLDNSGNNYTSFAGSKEMNTQLIGATTVSGKVADEYSPPGSTIDIAGATMQFRDHTSGDLRYTTTSDSNGDFTMNLGVTGNYKIDVSKAGYNSQTFDNLGSGYTAGSDISFNNVTNDYLRLKGTANVFGIVRDEKSNEYVYDAVVTIYEKSTGQPRYWQTVNGSYDFWIDGDMYYEIEADANGYPKKRFSNEPTGYSGGMELNTALKAQFQTVLKDAENPSFGIQNARVRLYHYYDDNYFGIETTPSISPLNITTLNVTVSCEDRETHELNYFDDINVTLEKTDSCLGYQSTLGLCWRTQNTTSGSTFFNTVVVGTYTVTVDGSTIGCGNKTEIMTITSDDAGGLMNKSYALDETTLRIKVIDPLWFVPADNSIGNLPNADVTILTPGPHTNTTPDSNGEGVFTFHFVRGIDNNVTGDDNYHYLNYSLYNVTPGLLNNFASIGLPSFSPLLLQPYPANLRINLMNLTGDGVDDGVVVDITNQSEFLVDNAFFTSHYSSTYTQTSSLGSANFNNIYSSVYWNVSINGTTQGYNHTYLSDTLIEAGNLSEINMTIRENTLLVHVYGWSGGSQVDVTGANVVLWNGSIGSSVAKNGVNDDLDDTTNGTGEILFTRTIPGTYNVSINATGFVPFETVWTLGINENALSPVLNDTTPPYYDAAWMTPVSPEQGDQVYIYVHWVDNAILEQAILQLKYEDNSEENHTYKAFIDDWSNFTLDSSYTNSHAGENISWRVIARDSSDNWNSSMAWTEFHIKDIESPVVSVTHTPTDVVAGMEVVFQASVSDNNNLSWVKIYVDYSDKSGDSGYNCTTSGGGTNMVCTWKSTGFDYDTTHYYYAVAADEDGNEGKDPDWELNETTGYNLPTGRSQGAAVYAGEIYPEKIYIIGGQEQGADVSDQILSFQPRNPASPVQSATMPQNRRGIAAAYDNDGGDIYIFGGTTGASWLNSILQFDLSSESVSTASATISSEQRNSPAAAYHYSGGYGYVYLFGGDNGTTLYSQNIWRYNVTADSGSNVGNLLTIRSKTAAVYSPVNDRIYIIGGRNTTSDISDILEYTPGGATTTLVASIPTSLEGLSAAYHAKTEKIYIFGGYNFNQDVYSTSIFEFDPQTNAVKTMNTTLPSPRAFTSTAFSAYDDKFYVFGGEDGTSYFYETVKYDPSYGKGFTVQMKVGNLTVYVEEDGGVPITYCGGWPYVRLSYAGALPNGKTFTPQTVDATNGQARFVNLYPELTYDYEVNGTSQGYGYESDTIYVDQEENNVTVIIDTTNLGINLTNASGVGVSADFSVYTNYPDILTTCDGTQLTGTTGSDGLASYSRVLPCVNCNLTASKSGATPSWGSVIFNVNSGQDNYVHLDPPGDSPSLGSTYPYYTDVIGDYNTLTVNVTSNSSGNLTPISYVNVTMLRDDGQPAASNLTNVFGLATINVIDGVYSMLVNGEERGYDSFLVEGLKIGKLVFANGTTDTNGQILMVVDGQPMYTPLEPHTPSGGYGYYARIETAGHGSYDSLEKGIGLFQGTFYDDARDAGNNDVNNSFTLNMYGLSMINGTVRDYFCSYTNCRVPGVTVKLLSGVQGPQVRYSKTTDANGTFSVRVSPFTSDSYWDSPINESYDVKTEKVGYVDYYASGHGMPSGIRLAKYQNITHDPELTGSGYVSGQVKSHEENPVTISGVNITFVVTESSSINQNIGKDTPYYKTISGGDGAFQLTINPYYDPYELIAEKNQSTYLARTVGPYNDSQSGLIIYLYEQGRGSIQFYVIDEAGQGIVNAKISVTGPETPPDRFTDQNGEAKVWSILGGGTEYDLTINSSTLGYGTNQTTVKVNSGQESIVNVTLPSTKINVTLISDTGESVDNVTVSLHNASGLLGSSVTANSSAVFDILPSDQYHMLFSGYNSQVYYINGESLESNTTYVNITDSDAGQTKNINYILNETRLLVNLLDYNGSALPNITVTITNVTDNASTTYYTTSDASGHALFREILPAHNYSIIFNESQLNSMGLLLQLETFSVGVFGGEDESTNNNISIVIGDVNVRFNVTNTLGLGIENVTISLLEANGSLAYNGYNEPLNGTTDASGKLTIHGVPNRTYSFNIDANETGYGIWNGSITVTLNNDENKVDIAGLNSLKLDVSLGTSPEENVTVSVLINGELAKNGKGQDLVYNITSSEFWTRFDYMLVYPTDYTVMVTSPRYFSESDTVSFELMNPSITHKNMSFTLTERSVTIMVRYGGSPLDEGVNVSLVNATDGSAVTGTNGSVIANKTNVTDSTAFDYIPDGIYNITVYSNQFFTPPPFQVNASEIQLGEDTYTINFTTERKIAVVVRNSTGNVLEEGVNISIQDGTGYVIMSLNGSYLNVTGITDSVDFTHIPDGQYVINVTSDRYFSDTQNFNTADITPGNYTYTFTMNERTIYIYLRDTDMTTLDYGVNVSLTDSGGGQLNGTNGQPIQTQTDETDTAIFNYVPDGENLIVSVVSNDYFSQNWTFNTTDIASNNSHTFIMGMRSLTVNAYHLTGDVITETVTVNLINGTGDVAKNTTGQFVNGSTDTGTFYFTGLLDGNYNITVDSANYTGQVIPFDPASGDNNEVNVYILKLDHGYFNVTVLVSASPLSGATVTLRFNDTTDVDSRNTGSDGIAVVGVNTSTYDQNLTVKVSRSGYYDNETDQYTITDQEIKDLTVTMKAVPFSPGGPSGPSGPSGFVGGIESETQILGDISANVAKSAKFTKSDTLLIDEIGVLTDQDASGVILVVKESGKPSGADAPISSANGKVRKYLDITATNLPDSIISRVTITFKVRKSWIESNDIDPNAIYMFRYSDGSWSRLPTSMLSEDDVWYYYRATSPGFSIFAIGGYYIGETGMDLTLPTLSVKGNECRTVSISVKNTGSATLTNLNIEQLDISCCSIRPVSGISSLSYGSERTMSVEICASMTTERGTYDYSLTVVSDQLRKTVDSKVYVTESYYETLLNELQDLENRLARLNQTMMNATELEYYDAALEKINESREYLSRREFDNAITLLGDAREYYQKIKLSGPPKGYLDMFLEWVMINYVLASVGAAIIVFLLAVVVIKWKVLAKQLPAMPDVGIPSGGEVIRAIKKTPDELIDSISGMVKELETRVDKIDMESLRDREKKWYNKVKMQIEGIKKNVDKGEFDKAKRNLNDAELFMKMLELNASSE